MILFVFIVDFGVRIMYFLILNVLKLINFTEATGLGIYDQSDICIILISMH